MVSYVPVTLTLGAMLLERIIGLINRLSWWDRLSESPSDEQIMAGWLVLWPQPLIAAAMALLLEIRGLRSLLPFPQSPAFDGLLVLLTPVPILGLMLAYVLGISPGRGLLVAIMYVTTATLPAVLLIGGLLSSR